MNYRARDAYKNKKIVDTYDKRRFSSIKGKIVDRLEKSGIEKAIKYISLPTGSRILDLPCGTGRIAVFLAQKGYIITGGDMSEEMIKKARGNAQKEGLLDRINFQILDAERIDYPDNCFDAVVSLRFFGHIPPEVRIRILEEFKRVSKRYLILAYYQMDTLQERLRRKRRAAAKSFWHPVKVREIDEEMKCVGIQRLRVFPIFQGISETIIVVGNPFAQTGKK